MAGVIVGLASSIHAGGTYWYSPFPPYFCKLVPVSHFTPCSMVCQSGKILTSLFPSPSVPVHCAGTKDPAAAAVCSHRRICLLSLTHPSPSCPISCHTTCLLSSRSPSHLPNPLPSLARRQTSQQTLNNPQPRPIRLRCLAYSIFSFNI